VLPQQLLEAVLLGGRQEEAVDGGAVIAGKALHRPADGGCVDHRQNSLDVVLKEAVKENPVAATQRLDQGKAGQVVVERIKGPPDTLHLLLEGLDLPGQQRLKAQAATLLAIEGRATVAPGVREQGGPGHHSLGGSGHDDAGGARQCAIDGRSPSRHDSCGSTP
jgi:hypothetical protein